MRLPINPFIPIIPDGGVLNVAALGGYSKKVLGYSPIAYWMMAEASGGTSTDEINSPAQDGAYTGVTLGQTGIGDGNTCPLFDGANDCNNIQTPTLTSAFSASAGTIATWVKVSGAGIWTDNQWRKIFVLYTDTNNQVYLAKGDSTQSNQLRSIYRANGTIQSVNIATTTTDWFHFAITWDKTTNQVKVYLNGTQQGSTQTGLDVWAGSLTISVLGASSIVPTQVWDGYMAHSALWTSALSPADIADLAVIP